MGRGEGTEKKGGWGGLTGGNERGILLFRRTFGCAQNLDCLCIFLYTFRGKCQEEAKNTPIPKFGSNYDSQL